MPEFVAERLRLHYFPAIVGKMPELREEFAYRRWFLSRRTAELDLAFAGTALALLTRSRAPLLAWAPYLSRLGRSAARWGRAAPEVAAGELAADVVGFGALASGSIRHGKLLI
jgi:hypothetical protein